MTTSSMTFLATIYLKKKKFKLKLKFKSFKHAKEPKGGCFVISHAKTIHPDSDGCLGQRRRRGEQGQPLKLKSSDSSSEEEQEKRVIKVVKMSNKFQQNSLKVKVANARDVIRETITTDHHIDYGKIVWYY